MNRSLLILFVAVFGAAAEENLRPPAVPLVVHDPYFSIWSMADHLTDQPTKHWTGKMQPLESLVRVDEKTFRIMGGDGKQLPGMEQKSVTVMPTHTRYSFAGAGIELELTFFNPLLPDDLEQLSRPVTYVTWRVKSADGAPHQVQLYFDASSQIAVNTPDEPVEWGRLRMSKLEALRAGSREQPVLKKSGDDLRIDWGHLYVVALPEESSRSAIGSHRDVAGKFVASGSVPDSDDLEGPAPYAWSAPVLAESWDLGAVSSTMVERHALIAYDDEYALEYLGRRLRPYWRRNGMGIAELLHTAVEGRASLEDRGQQFDSKWMAKFEQAGGVEYARICALAFPQTLAAHKLAADTDGTLLYFSKENFSNGSIDTVDITYPSSPFFLLFNPVLLQAQVQPVMDYANLPRWRFPFAPHDLGRYPLANGQQYGGGETSEENQMPVEESGNMLLVSAAMTRAEGNTAFAKRYWPVMTKWAEYLKAKGLDPESQLSTDDFAGHLAHNANLSAKAILALAAYGQMADKLGEKSAAGEYMKLARRYAGEWGKMARENDHYRLAFDQANTWSQKYNLVWDKLLELHLFNPEIVDTELKYYATRMNRFGVPLDSRKSYTKLDWLAWTATLSKSREEFEALFVKPAYVWLNETPTRVPMTDWYDTISGRQEGFQARSVVGGIFVRLLPN